MLQNELISNLIMFVSIYYKPSLFNAHTTILIVHIFMNVNKLCLNQQDFTEIVEKQKEHLNTTFYTAHVLHTYVKTPYSDSLQIC